MPVDVVLMLDASSSWPIVLMTFAARLRSLPLARPQDRLCLIKFDDRVELLQDWTRADSVAARAKPSPGVFTRFNDALVLAAREQFRSTQARRAVIVLTDGIDSGRGAASFDGALSSLLQSQVSVYVVSNTEIERAAKKRELDAMGNLTESAARFNQLRTDDLKEGLRIIDKSEERLQQLASSTGGGCTNLGVWRPGLYLRGSSGRAKEPIRSLLPPLNKGRDGTFRRTRIETVSFL